MQHFGHNCFFRTGNKIAHSSACLAVRLYTNRFFPRHCWFDWDWFDCWLRLIVESDWKTDSKTVPDWLKYYLYLQKKWSCHHRLFRDSGHMETRVIWTSSEERVVLCVKVKHHGLYCKHKYHSSCLCFPLTFTPNSRLFCGQRPRHWGKVDRAVTLFTVNLAGLFWRER